MNILRSGTILLASSLLIASACHRAGTGGPKFETGESGSPDFETADTSEPDDTDVKDTGGDPAQWEGATLRVLHPQSADFLPLGESSDFEAHVYNAAGDVTGFEQIQWSSSLDSAWLPVGEQFSDANLIAGVHDLTAQASLPNGDRLAYTVGGILVQSPYAGTYTGTLLIDGTVTYNKNKIPVYCAGASTLIIDASGETITGGADCVVSLYGYDASLVVTIEGGNDAGNLAGTANVGLDWYGVDCDFTGTVSEDGTLDLAFGYKMDTYFVGNGEISATRISRDTEEK